MSNKPHLLFKNPVEGIETYHPQPRGGGQKEEPEREPDYTMMAENFAIYLRNFNNERRERVVNRTLSVPTHVEYIDIEFQNIFNADGRTSTNYENTYYARYGLSPVKFYDFNRKVLFAVIHDDRFDYFLQQLQLFANTENHNQATYNGDIKFIKAFSFLSSSKILNINPNDPIKKIRLVENDELFQVGTQDALTEALISYLKYNKIPYQQESLSNTIELTGITQHQLNEVADNFDIIQSINSSSSGIIRPSAYGLPIREHGFTISAPAEDLPIVGVIDTGVSNQTPLRELLIADPEFNITTTNQFLDNVDHGTAVAGLVALGTKPYPNFRGEFEPDAKILPIKVLDRSSGGLPFNSVISLIRRANEKYGIRIFTLTIGYYDNLIDNQEFSDYALALDKLSQELDVLVIISTTNRFCDSNIREYSITIFSESDSCISSPAESMNNITVGACADNLEEQNYLGFSPDYTFPALYSRRFHIDQESIFKKCNKHFVKPDMIYFGGDYSITEHPIWGISLDHESAGLKVLSSRASEGVLFEKVSGTSYSAPLVANLAAKIIRLYPVLKMQSVKALIINSCKPPKIEEYFNGYSKLKLRGLIGHGIPSETNCIYSTENDVTFILEDSITKGELKIYPLRIPRYLNSHAINNGLLEINATLTFSFSPIKDNQLVYCPYHLAFIVLRNRRIDEINRQTLDDNRISSGWSQDAYYKRTVLSNTQKTRITVGRDKIINENNTFKIGINANYHKYLTDRMSGNLAKEIQFSLIIQIRENVSESRISNRLYNEIQLVNTLDAIGEIDLEAEV